MIALLALVLAQTPPGADDAHARPLPPPAEVKQEAPALPPELACQRWKAPGLIEGPVSIGYAAADLTLGRRACPGKAWNSRSR